MPTGTRENREARVVARACQPIHRPALPAQEVTQTPIRKQAYFEGSQRLTAISSVRLATYRE